MDAPRIVLDRPLAGTYAGLPPGLEAVHLRVYEAALPFLDTRSNDVHARISCQYAVEMLQHEGGDAAVVIPAILTHDVGWHDIPEEDQRKAYGPNSTDAALNRLHETAGARRAAELLRSLDYRPDLVPEICRIIGEHDSKPTADTIEEAIVKDADKVWRVSRLGFPSTLGLLGNLSPQELHDFIAVRVPRWFLTRTGTELVRAELAARRRELGLAPAPDIPPPPGYGIGDVELYAQADGEGP